MHVHFIAVPLPRVVQSRLASLCYGLPQVRWVDEENLHLTLRYLGSLTDAQVSEIQEDLKSLFFHPFTLKLKGLGHFRSRSHGVIWAGIEEHPGLLALKKEIDAHLRKFTLPPDDRPFHPHITLGRYDRLNIEKLADYLDAHSNYQSDIFEVTHCHLLRTQQTPKRVFYPIVESYAASQLESGDD
jgi:RNA 2',3'-cyclic 3'-phosphodiesterase